ncbi:ribosome maturation factor RimM [Candidatus Gillettellia adelgis]
MIVIRTINKPIPPTTPLLLGKIGSTYGIHGWLRVFSYTENPESIFDYQPWLLHQADQWQCVEIKDWKRHKHGLIVKFNYINHRDAAFILTHSAIIINDEQLPLLKGNDYYWKDIINCQVIIITGYVLGKVTHMIETGSNDVMVVTADQKDTFDIKKRLVPFLFGQVIKNIDLSARIIEVDWNPSF